MKHSANVMRWLEHLLLIILLILVGGSYIPFGRVFAAVNPLAVSSEVRPVGEEHEEHSEQLTSLLSDIGDIYRTAATYPLHEVRGEITSPGILAFYDGYLQAAGLAPDSQRVSR